MLPLDENHKLILHYKKNKTPLDQTTKPTNKTASGLVKWLSNNSKLRMK